MKRIILAVIISISFTAFILAQNNGKPAIKGNTPSTVYYCMLVKQELYNSFNGALLKDEMWVDYGNISKYPFAAEEKNVIKSLKSEMDAVNYLSGKGWELVQVIQHDLSNGGEYLYYFRNKSQVK